MRQLRPKRTRSLTWNPQQKTDAFRCVDREGRTYLIRDYRLPICDPVLKQPIGEAKYSHWTDLGPITDARTS